jgi:hypothetical protein
LSLVADKTDSGVAPAASSSRISPSVKPSRFALPMNVSRHNESSGYWRYPEADRGGSSSNPRRS